MLFIRIKMISKQKFFQSVKLFLEQFDNIKWPVSIFSKQKPKKSTPHKISNRKSAKSFANGHINALRLIYRFVLEAYGRFCSIFCSAHTFRLEIIETCFLLSLSSLGLVFSRLINGILPSCQQSYNRYGCKSSQSNFNLLAKYLLSVNICVGFYWRQCWQFLSQSPLNASIRLNSSLFSLYRCCCCCSCFHIC